MEQEPKENRAVCSSAPASGYATVAELVGCFAAWEPDVRVVGNVRAGDAVSELTAILAEVSQLKNELERERMRLAACGVVAMANTPESATRARDMHPEYRSASCDDVARAIDREIALRDGFDPAEKLPEKGQEVVVWLVGHNGSGYPLQAHRHEIDGDWCRWCPLEESDEESLDSEPVRWWPMPTHNDEAERTAIAVTARQPEV